jgi:acetyl-CoA/propionyl-CoA carboxylase biotin carboxyl carrier protein
LAKHKFAINDTKYEVDVGARKAGRVQVTVNGKAYEVELEGGAAQVVSVKRPASAAPPPMSAPQPSGGSSVGDGAVCSPMAGLVLSIRVKVGDQVASGDDLLMLEAMKMENAITAHRAGTIKRVAVEPQQVVNQGDVLVEIG